MMYDRGIDISSFYDFSIGFCIYIYSLFVGPGWLNELGSWIT